MSRAPDHWGCQNRFEFQNFCFVYYVIEGSSLSCSQRFVMHFSVLNETKWKSVILMKLLISLPQWNPEKNKPDKNYEHSTFTGTTCVYSS